MLNFKPISEAKKDGSWLLVKDLTIDSKYPPFLIVNWYSETRPDCSVEYDGWHNDSGLPVNISDSATFIYLSELL